MSKLNARVAAVLASAFILALAAAPRLTSAGESPAATNGMIAFFARTGDIDAGFDLVVMNADGTSPRTILPAAVFKGGCGFGLTWSPDGNQIAYASDNGVYIVDADGSGNHQVTTYCGGSLDWSPNGQWLAVDGGGQGVFLVHPDGTGVHWLRPEHGAYYEFSPSFSADSLQVIESTVFVGEGNGWGVYGVNANTGDLATRYVSIDTAHPGSIAHGIDVRRDGGSILFDLSDIRTDNECDPLMTGNAWQSSDIYKVNATADAPLTRIGNTTNQRDLRESEGSWSPDGQSIVFVGYKFAKCNGTSEVQTPQSLYSMTPSGGNVKLLYTAPGEPSAVFDPQWQPCTSTTKSCTVPKLRCRGQLANVVGTAGDDTLTGTAGNDVIAALGGNDTITALGGNDIVCAGAGNDTVSGGDGDDTIFGEDGRDTLNGDAGADRIIGGAAADAISGGDDDDILVGGGDNDTINGDAGADRISGRGGNDKLDGGSGVDRVLGELGDDRLKGGDDSDKLVGGGGKDTLSGEGGNDTLLGRADDDRLDGGDGNDTLDGGGGTDRVDGGFGDDRVNGGTGDDTVLGGDGTDKVHGDAGDDKLGGGTGSADLCDGDTGTDSLVASHGCENVAGVP